VPGGSGDYADEGDECEVHDAIPTTSLRLRPVTDPERFDLGTSDVDRYEGEDGDDADADDEGEVSQADDGSMQKVVD
jgi:hypothetical protein